MLPEPNYLPNNALIPVSGRRRADFLADGDPKTTGLVRTWAEEQLKVGVAEFFSLSNYVLKFLVPGYAIGFVYFKLRPHGIPFRP